MDCSCEGDYLCQSCRERAIVLRNFELVQQARDFALEYVGWYTPEPASEEVEYNG